MNLNIDENFEKLSDEEKGKLISESDSITHTSWITKAEYEALKKWNEEIRNNFIEQVRNMDWAARALAIHCADSEHFAENNDLQTVQLMKDIKQAWEIIKNEKNE